MNFNIKALCGASGAALLLAACAGVGRPGPAGLPQLGAATGTTLANCNELSARLSFADARIGAVNAIAAGTLTVTGAPVAAHCQITGTLNQRISAVDGKPYAIGFEMRLPLAWNGRFLHQVNGGTDGNIGVAVGGIGGGGPAGTARATYPGLMTATCVSLKDGMKR